MDRRSSGDAGQDPVAATWTQRALELARWAIMYLVVRDDAYGGHRADGNRTTVHEQPSRQRLARHFAAYDVTDVLGLHVSSRDEMCRTTWIDIDAHDGQDAILAINLRFAKRVLREARRLGIDARLMESNGRGGYHILIVHAEPIPLAQSWRLGKFLVRKHAAYGYATPPETFPKGPRLTGKRFGGWVRLPGRHHKRDHWTRVWSPKKKCWLEGHDAIDSLLRLEGHDVDLRSVIPDDFNPNPRRARRTRRGLNDETRLTGWRHALTVRRARSALEHLGATFRDDYDGWLRIGMALRELGPDGLDLWDNWSKASSRYEAGATADKWSSLKPGSSSSGVTLGTLFALASAEGWDGFDEKSDPHTGLAVKTKRSGSRITIIIMMTSQEAGSGKDAAR